VTFGLETDWVVTTCNKATKLHRNTKLAIRDCTAQPVTVSTSYQGCGTSPRLTVYERNMQFYVETRATELNTNINLARRTARHAEIYSYMNETSKYNYRNCRINYSN